MLPGEVAVHRAGGEGGGDSEVGKPRALQRSAHELLARLPAGNRLAEVEVQHRAAGVFRLQFLLAQERFEWVIGETDGELGGGRVVRDGFRSRLQGAWEPDTVLLG